MDRILSHKVSNGVFWLYIKFTITADLDSSDVAVIISDINMISD